MKPLSQAWLHSVNATTRRLEVPWAGVACLQRTEGGGDDSTQPLLFGLDYAEHNVGLAPVAGGFTNRIFWDDVEVRGGLRWHQRGERGAGGLTPEVETPLPSTSPHDHMILRVELVGSRGRWKRPCLNTSPHDHMTLRVGLVVSHRRWTRPCLNTAHMTI